MTKSSFKKLIVVMHSIVVPIAQHTKKCRLAFLGVRLGGTLVSFTQIGQRRPGPVS